MKIYDRKEKIYFEEKEFGKKKLEFLYNTFVGRILLKLIFARRYYSVLNGLFMKSRLSVKKIKPFAEEYCIDITEYEKTKFSSFDDFFTRKKKYVISEPPERIISPADGRLSVFEIDEKLILKIKNSVYDLDELTGGKTDMSGFSEGCCLVLRLAVEDCHRYIFVDKGRVLKKWEINGELHTVRPISEKYRVFSRNHRICTLMETEHFGKILQIEIGALQIGRINDRPVKKFERAEEKGYFSYGGSTIILILQKGKIKIDSDISGQKCETFVRLGEGIGTAIRLEG